MAPPLLEREREIGELDALVAAAARGEGGVLVLEGPAGIGKTALVERACDAARASGVGVGGNGNGRAGDEPRLVVLDDAHAVDAGSLRTARRHAAVLLAARDGGTEPRGALDAIRAAPTTRVVVLAPLSQRAGRALLAAMFGRRVGARFAYACHQATGGNPRYLVELQRALAHDGVEPRDADAGRVQEMAPAALERYVHAQLAALSPDAPRLAGALTIVGDGGSLRLAARVAGIPERSAAAIARALVRATILRSDDPVRFAQPIVRRVVAAQLTCIEQDDGHLAAARLLSAAHAPPERVAAHLLRTRPDARAWCVAALREAAGAAVAHGAPEAAGAYLRRAAEEPPAPAVRAAVLRELGAAERLAGDPAAVEHLEQARQAARDAHTRAEIALDLARTLRDRFRAVDACRTVQAALAELDPGERELRARLEAALVSSAFLDAATVEAGASVLAERAGDLPPGPAGRTLAGGQAQSMLLGGQPAARVRAAVEAALAGADERDLGGTFESALVLMISADGFERAAQLIERYAALASVQATAARAVALEWIRGLLAARLGELEQAELRFRSSLEHVPAASADGGVLAIRGQLAEVLRLQGRLDEAERTLAEGPPKPWPDHVGATLAVAAEARLCFDRGRVDDGLAALAELSAREAAWGPSGPGLTQWRADAAVALAATGRRRQARAMIGPELARARAHGAPRALGRALRASGVAEGGPAGLTLLDEAVSVLRGSPAALDRAAALVELGSALRRANQRRAARACLDAGMRLSQRCGARPLAWRAYEELTASGRRLRRSDLDDPNALTPAERRVARCAAAGMSNRAIADSLYLSVKTIEMHLGRAYRKLGITTRAQLPEALVGDQG